jgi:hypothetical protein
MSSNNPPFTPITQDMTVHRFSPGPNPDGTPSAVSWRAELTPGGSIVQVRISCETAAVNDAVVHTLQTQLAAIQAAVMSMLQHSIQVLTAAAKQEGEDVDDFIARVSGQLAELCMLQSPHGAVNGMIDLHPIEERVDMLTEALGKGERVSAIFQQWRLDSGPEGETKA